jgi:hypothetical protein
MEGGAQPRNSPAALPRRCPQTGHGLGDRKVGLGREPARGHTLKFVGHAPGPIGAAAPASAPGSPKRPVGRPVRRFSLRLSAALAGCGETKRCRGFLMRVVNLMTKAKCSKLTRNVLTDSNCGRKFYCGDVLGSPQNTLRCETHSTPGVRLASFLFFLIFGTAERTPFAPKTLWILPRGKNLTADSAPLAS